jgi:broad specificity phosphatase PhoE
MSAAGIQDITQSAQEFARRGGVNKIIAGPLTRTRQTAQIVKNFNPTASVGLNANLQAWNVGGLEGMPKDLVKRQIEGYVRRPDMIPPGRSPSGRPGESYKHFGQRLMVAVSGAMQDYLRHPNSIDLLVVHRSVISWLHGWLKNGMPADGAADPGAVLADKPEGAWRLAPAKGGVWSLTNVPMESSGRNKPGVYLMPHGVTGLNRKDQFGKGQVVNTPQAA